MDKIAERVEQAISERVFPGCVIGTIAGGTHDTRAFGTLDYGTTLVTKNTIYDLASITKSIPVAALASIFIHEGMMALTEPVRKYVPEIAHDFDATIEDLLRYRVKGVRMSSLQFSTFEEVRAHALERGFDGPPGAHEYTNLPAFVLGIILERVGGAQIATLAHHRIFEPLGMYTTTFFPAAVDCAPTEIVAGETVRGMPHDESARIFAQARRSAGHAGLFSTAGDLLIFAQHLIDHPEQVIVRDAQAGLGWQIENPYLFGSRSISGAFGKTGFTGTSIMLDPTMQRALVILSNRTYPERPADTSAITAFRRDVTDIFHNYS